jgi:hypothetical protein
MTPSAIRKRQKREEQKNTKQTPTNKPRTTGTPTHQVDLTSDHEDLGRRDISDAKQQDPDSSGTEESVTGKNPTPGNPADDEENDDDLDADDDDDEDAGDDDDNEVEEELEIVRDSD